MRIFISHISEEAPIALTLQRFIHEVFSKRISVFASSNLRNLTPGDEWLDKLRQELKECQILLVLCSPSSLSRPWINFETGCSWIEKKKIIPVCHSGQEKSKLPFPFCEFQALQLEDLGFGKHLVQALCEHAGMQRTLSLKKNLDQELVRETRRLTKLEAAPQIIHCPQERTKWINADLQTLLRSKKLKKETVWLSAFLSTFAINPADRCFNNEKGYLQLLLKERNLLLSLAKRGCNVKCIISPSNKNYLRHTGIPSAINRTKQLLQFIESKDPALKHIDWAVSEFGIKNLYIIGQRACIEGYKQGIQHGYSLTLRETSPNAINTSTEVYMGFFRNLSAKTLAKWSNRNGAGGEERELLRLATARCLRASLEFLTKHKKM